MNKYFKVLGVASLVLGLTSCLKDKDFEDNKYGLTNADSKTIELGYLFNQDHDEGISVNFIDSSVNVGIVNVHLASGQVAQEDITVTLDTTNMRALIDKVDPDAVTLPSSFYSFPNGLKVTIPKGAQEAKLQIKTNAILFDLSTKYALAFRLKSVDQPGYAVSSNFGTFVTTLGAKNKYAGLYIADGVRTRYNGPSVASGVLLPLFPFSDYEKEFITYNANTIEGGLGDSGSGVTVRYTINPDNTVIIKSTVGTSPIGAILNDPAAGPTVYDPATSTLTIHASYLNGAGNLRTVTETMVAE